MAKIFLIIIRGYQYGVSPLLGNHCRFYPCCSDYTKEAISHFGILKGLMLSLQRMGRCQPWHQGGYDPVPLK